MILLSWIRIFLILIPLAIVGFSIYWIVLVTEPVFMAACGAGRIVLGVLILALAFSSAMLAFLAFKELPAMDYSKLLFHAYFVTTCICVFLIVIAMISTSTESQSICTMQIAKYCEKYADGKTSAYLSKYNSAYKRLLYQYAFGQNSYEAFLIINCAWVAAFIAFFAMAELK